MNGSHARDSHPRAWPWLENLLRGSLADPRDAVVVQRALGVLVFVPFAAVLFVPGVFSWPLALIYLALVVPSLGPNAVRVHLMAHRPLFVRRLDGLNGALRWGLAMFCGISPAMYFAHHVGMHHPEENLPPDASSTLFYQRDSRRMFASYFLRFILISRLEVLVYLVRHKRWRLVRQALVGELVHRSILVGLLFLNWEATLATLLLPEWIVCFGLMIGNWTEHAFIDRAQPGNPYRNSVTLINDRYNVNMFNDGYHAAHHVRPSLHWADLPGAFERDRSRYEENDAVVFDGAGGWQRVWWLLMVKDYDALARHLVPLGNIPVDPAARAAWIRTRTARA